MPQISIIIPAYNAAKTIAETIKSVREQTFTDWESIVVNDGSTDNTLEVVSKIVEPRLKIISSTNQGVAEARNLGIANGKGEYIAFLDADDLWLSDKLASQLQALEQNPDANVAYSWTCFMDEQASGYVYHSCPPYQYTGDVYPRLLRGDFIHSGSNVLVRKSALDTVGGFDRACSGCEDWDMWLRLAARGKYVVVPKHQIIYRRAVGSTTSNVGKMYERALYTIAKAYEDAPAKLQSLRPQTEANLEMYIASLYLQHGTDSLQAKQAGKHLRYAIATYLPILRQTFMQKLIVKFWLRYLLPPQLGRSIFEKLRAIVAIADPRK